MRLLQLVFCPYFILFLAKKVDERNCFNCSFITIYDTLLSNIGISTMKSKQFLSLIYEAKRESYDIIKGSNSKAEWYFDCSLICFQICLFIVKSLKFYELLLLLICATYPPTRCLLCRIFQIDIIFIRGLNLTTSYVLGW